MDTLREVISDVRNSLNAVNQDQWLPGKFIHSKLLSTARLFLKREADDKRLYLYSAKWPTLKCVEMEKTPTIQCCDVDLPNHEFVMRSVHPIPELFTTRFGYVAIINSLEDSTRYTVTTPNKYRNTIGKKYQDATKRYAWIDGENHLVIPNSRVSKVKITGMFVSPYEVEVMNNPGKCINFLDQDFPMPGHLLKDVKDATVQAMLGKKQIVPDEFPDNNQLNVKANGQR